MGSFVALTGASVQSWAGPGRAEGRADRAAGGGKSGGTEVLPSQKKSGRQGKDLGCGLRSGCGKHVGSGIGRGLLSIHCLESCGEVRVPRPSKFSKTGHFNLYVKTSQCSNEFAQFAN